jgi:hypothetical protein
MIATCVPVGTEAGAPPGLMSRLRQAGEAAGPPGDKRRGFDWRVGGLADRRYLRDPSRPVQPMCFAICDNRLGHKSRAGQALGQERSERSA